MLGREVACAAKTRVDVSAEEPKPKENKLWGGRFQESVTDVVERFTESISFDKALYKHDIMGSRAHASMLAKQVFFFYPSLSLSLCGSFRLFVLWGMFGFRENVGELLE